jgi:hypothetical protein
VGTLIEAHETAPVAAKRMALYAERQGTVAATAG